MRRIHAITGAVNALRRRLRVFEDRRQTRRHERVAREVEHLLARARTLGEEARGCEALILAIRHDTVVQEALLEGLVVQYVRVGGIDAVYRGDGITLLGVHLPGVPVRAEAAHDEAGDGMGGGS